MVRMYELSVHESRIRQIELTSSSDESYSCRHFEIVIRYVILSGGFIQLPGSVLYMTSDFVCSNVQTKHYHIVYHSKQLTMAQGMATGLRVYPKASDVFGPICPGPLSADHAMDVSFSFFSFFITPIPVFF